MMEKAGRQTIRGVAMIESVMFNQDGRAYGLHVQVEATNERQALDMLLNAYGEERVFGPHDVGGQFVWDWSPPTS